MMMASQPFRVAVLANTIFPGGGLMQFLKQSLTALAKEKPDWRFIVIGSISQEFLKDLNHPAIEVVWWDDTPRNRLVLSVAKKLLKGMGKSRDAGFLLQSRSERYGLPWGDAGKVRSLISQCDVVWVTHYNIDLERLSTGQLLGDLQIPQLFTIHDIHPAFYPEDHAPGNLVRFYKGFFSFTRSCSAMITHSEVQKRMVVQQMGVPPERVIVTPQPPLIDPAFLLQQFDAAETQKIRAELGVDRPFVFYPASTLHIHKNHTRLMVAWSMLKAKFGDRCPLLVFTNKGSRKQWRKIEALIGELDIQDKVVFVGQVSNEQLAVLFQNCLFVALPTLYEGSGSGVLTDAYVTGKRVLCSTIPQIQEQLRVLPGANVQFFDGNSVLSIFETLEAEISSILAGTGSSEGASQAQISERFNTLWQGFAQCYAGVMAQIAAENGGRTGDGKTGQPLTLP